MTLKTEGHVMVYVTFSFVRLLSHVDHGVTLRDIMVAVVFIFIIRYGISFKGQGSRYGTSRRSSWVTTIWNGQRFDGSACIGSHVFDRNNVRDWWLGEAEWRTWSVESILDCGFWGLNRSQLVLHKQKLLLCRSEIPVDVRTRMRTFSCR